MLALNDPFCERTRTKNLVPSYGTATLRHATDEGRPLDDLAGTRPRRLCSGSTRGSGADEPAGHHPFDPVELTGVILGASISNQDRDAVLS